LRKLRQRRRSELTWRQWSLQKRSSVESYLTHIVKAIRTMKIEEPMVVSPAVSILYIREELKPEIAC
jgi:hypothetical protein